MITHELPAGLVQIGRVCSPWTDTHDIPLQGGPATIDIDPNYEPALECIERTSHLVVIAYLHKADRSVLKAAPRKLKCDAPPCGVFSTRSPARPNPLSLTMVELVGRAGLVLHVTPLDLVDGTPVVDLKAYSPGWDNVFAAQSIRRVSSNQLPDSLLIPFLQRDIRNYLGDRASARPAQAALEAMVRVVREFNLDPRDPELHVEINGCDAATDALMAMTGASFSTGRIAVFPDDGPRRARFYAGDRRHTETLE
jgi:tRNA-Thr(GGU) m(6)t(6)A37 methyltransferase TsaA